MFTTSLVSIVTCILHVNYIDTENTFNTKLPSRFSGRFHKGCARQWLFQVSTGRSGSTTLKTVLNNLPGVYIAGENGGMVSSLLELRKKSDRTGYNERNNDAWSHKQINKKALNKVLKLYVQTAIGAKADVCYTEVGFKEIRYTVEELNFLKELFPFAKFIVNIRKDTQKQFESQTKFFGKERSLPTLDSINKMNAALSNWANKNSKIAFQLPLEDFSALNFNALFKWLNFTQCTLIHLPHQNYDGYKLEKQTNVVKCADT